MRCAVTVLMMSAILDMIVDDLDVWLERTIICSSQCNVTSITLASNPSCAAN
jgi:hypothetical protein